MIRATDADGDFVDLDGRLKITVTDDIPQVSITTTGASVIHDETSGIDAGSNDTVDPAVAALFAALEASVPGGLNEIGYAASGSPVVQFGSALGTDEPRSASVAIEVIGGNGTDSGLVTTAGRQVSLYFENGLIVGRVDLANGNPNPNGAIAFAVAIDQQGQISVAQYVRAQASYCRGWHRRLA